jgi:NitT/TauT family transport system ATP-binding protein
MKWEDICIRFRARNSIVIRVCNGQVNNGEIILITGPSGVGKSTFLKTLSGLVRQSGVHRFPWPFRYSASIYFEGSITPPDGSLLHDYTSYMPQEPPFFDGLSIFDNVRLACRTQKTKIDLEKELKSLLHYLTVDHDLNTRVELLSGGERQRIAIARCLLDDSAKLFCLDEPFSEMDPLNRRRAMDLIYKQSLDQKRSFLIVSHNIGELIPFATNILAFEYRPGRVTDTSAFRLVGENGYVPIPQSLQKLLLSDEGLISLISEVAEKPEPMHILATELTMVVDAEEKMGIEALTLGPCLGDHGDMALFVLEQEISVNGRTAKIVPRSILVNHSKQLMRGTRVRLVSKYGAFRCHIPE